MPFSSVKVVFLEKLIYLHSYPPIKCDRLREKNLTWVDIFEEIPVSSHFFSS